MKLWHALFYGASAFLLYHFLRECSILDVESRRYLKALGGDTVVYGFICEAKRFCNKSNSVCHAFVVSEIELAAAYRGFEIPAHIINILIEHVYRQYKLNQSRATIDLRASV